MQFKVMEEHKSDNTSPIIIKKGEKIRIGKRSDGIEDWPNWIYCYSLDGNSDGWTPEQIIKIENGYGLVLEDYSAKELDVEQGEIVEGERELNGWIWCNKSNGIEHGWLPKDKIAAVDVF